MTTCERSHTDEFIEDTLLCLYRGGEGQIANFGEKNSSLFNYYKRMT